MQRNFVLSAYGAVSFPRLDIKVHADEVDDAYAQASRMAEALAGRYFAFCLYLNGEEIAQIKVEQPAPVVTVTCTL